MLVNASVAKVTKKNLTTGHQDNKTTGYQDIKTVGYKSAAWSDLQS